MLIRRAELHPDKRCDVRIRAGVVAQIGDLLPIEGEPVVDARGGALLPGLHDHHIHMFALAARAASLFCGPPEINDREALAVRLAVAGTVWLRGVGYHESVAGMLDVRTLDRLVPHRPVRIQHRGGRMWFLNSLAIEELLGRAAAPPGMERDANGFTGRLFEEDAWLRTALGSQMPDLRDVSRKLARYGITGITDMSPANDPAVARHFAAEHERGALLQSCLLAGRLSLGVEEIPPATPVGPAKLHLHEAALPDYSEAVDFIRRAHAQARVVAIHCTTEVELVFALAALDDAGVHHGDRIEHASVASDALVAEIARLGLAVVAQPNFVPERGDAYRTDIPAEEWPSLYRLRSFLDASVTLAAGSDAPFGEPDPWAAMAGAVSRRTFGGELLGAREALAPEEALALYLAHPRRLEARRAVAAGEAADLCLLDRSWEAARSVLSADLVRTTIIGGEIAFDRIDQPPFERSSGTDPLP